MTSRPLVISGHAEPPAFEGGGREELDEAAADAHGYVDDLLRACREQRITDIR